MANAYGKYGAASRDNAQFFRAQWDRLAEKVRRYVAETELQDPTNRYFLDCLHDLQPAPNAGGFKIDSALGTMRRWLEDCDGFYARFPEETEVSLLAEQERIAQERIAPVRHKPEQPKTAHSSLKNSMGEKSRPESLPSRRRR